MTFLDRIVKLVMVVTASILVLRRYRSPHAPAPAVPCLPLPAWRLPSWGGSLRKHTLWAGIGVYGSELVKRACSNLPALEETRLWRRLADPLRRRSGPNQFQMEQYAGRSKIATAPCPSPSWWGFHPPNKTSSDAQRSAGALAETERELPRRKQAPPIPKLRLPGKSKAVDRGMMEPPSDETGIVAEGLNEKAKLWLRMLQHTLGTWRVPEPTKPDADVNSMATKTLPTSPSPERRRPTPRLRPRRSSRPPVPHHSRRSSKPPVPPQPHVWIPRAALGRDSVDVGIGYADIGIAGSLPQYELTEEERMLKSLNYSARPIAVRGTDGFIGPFQLLSSGSSSPSPPLPSSKRTTVSHPRQEKGTRTAAKAQVDDDAMKQPEGETPVVAKEEKREETREESKEMAREKPQDVPRDKCQGESQRRRIEKEPPAEKVETGEAVKSQVERNESKEVTNATKDAIPVAKDQANASSSKDIGLNGTSDFLATKRKSGERNFRNLLSSVGRAGLWLPRRILATPLQNWFLYYPRIYKDYPSIMDLNVLLEGFGMEIQALNYSFSDMRNRKHESVAYTLKTRKTKVKTWWLMFGGNAMLALDWVTFANSMLEEGQRTRILAGAKKASTGFLLFDYPGYGGVPGRPSPESILEASLAAVEELKTIEGEDFQLNVLGYSLGAAAALQFLAAAKEKNILPMNRVSRIILSAPFTSVPDMAHLMFKIPKGVANSLITHRWDNEGALSQFRNDIMTEENTTNTINEQTSMEPLYFTIIHGKHDALVPVQMGEHLARSANQTSMKVTLKVIGGCDHTGIIDDSNPGVRKAFIEAMFGGT